MGRLDLRRGVVAFLGAAALVVPTALGAAGSAGPNVKVSGASPFAEAAPPTLARRGPATSTAKSSRRSLSAQSIEAGTASPTRSGPTSRIAGTTWQVSRHGCVGLPRRLWGAGCVPGVSSAPGRLRPRDGPLGDDLAERRRLRDDADVPGRYVDHVREPVDGRRPDVERADPTDPRRLVLPVQRQEHDDGGPARLRLRVCDLGSKPVPE